MQRLQNVYYSIPDGFLRLMALENCFDVSVFVVVQFGEHYRTLAMHYIPMLVMKIACLL